MVVMCVVVVGVVVGGVVAEGVVVRIWAEVDVRAYPESFRSMPLSSVKLYKI